MNKKIFLTSAVIMCMACPAIAESFPSDGNMVENKTYDNAATYTNTGVYEGDVTANAYYDLNPYTVAAGSYFTGLDNNNNATTAQCTSGNYCPGVQSTTYDDVNSAFVDDGLQTCPSGYASSDLGASADTQCYRTCDIANMGENGTIAAIAHAATLTGNDYYGAGTDTCEPATCVAGWHVKRFNLSQQIGSEEDHINSAVVRDFFGYSSSEFDGSSNNKPKSYYGFSEDENNVWALEFNGGLIVKGTSSCNDSAGVSGDSRADGAFSNDSVGAYCWCQITGVKDGTEIPSHSSWFYLYDFHAYNNDIEQNCARWCPGQCMDIVKNKTLRPSVLASVASGPASCEANTINITWNDASAEDIAATGAATTVYEGDIKTPLKAVTKPGKTFVGWKFIKPTTPVQQ